MSRYDVKKCSGCGFECAKNVMWKHTCAHVRFWQYVNKTETCWLWTARLSNCGHGQFLFDRKYGYAHRFAYEMLVGKVPLGLELDHLCRVPSCVNPAHLEAVTHRTNVLRGAGITARNAAKTHCANGHEFTESNTFKRSRGGGRDCRECHNSNARRRYKERSA